LLRPERLDRDLLEERARAILGYAHKNEIVLFDRAGSR
jgi:cell division protein FtsB